MFACWINGFTNQNCVRNFDPSKYSALAKTTWHANEMKEKQQCHGQCQIIVLSFLFEDLRSVERDVADYCLAGNLTLNLAHC